jgi:hypothetical protein
MPENALMMAVWFGVLLLFTVFGYVLLPGWWRGTRRSMLSDRRQRVFPAGLLAITFLLLFGLCAALVGEDGKPGWLFGTALGLLIAGVLLLVLLPLVAYLPALDFLVPPWLRRGAPPRPAPAPVVVTARRPAKRSKRPVEPDDGKGTIRILRPANAWRDFTRKYRVEVDGGEVGRLRRGGDVSVRVPAGAHTVRGVIDWTGSPAITVAVRPGQTTLVRLLPSDANAREAIKADDTYLRIEIADHR